MLVTEFEFTLPKGYLDAEGTLHRKGIMRLARAMDEIAPLKDPRVKANPAYVTVIILSRVILKLGALDDVNPMIVENFFAEDLNFLQQFYRHINGLTERGSSSSASTARDPVTEVGSDELRSRQL